uniref:Mediator of RNA polymerase II transcription subunit 31 n=1 Tax=Toxocara canis TaxID=6265 RepID=A0A183TV30_TOXCA
LGTVGGAETPEEQKKRFEVECEFVQALANPHYLNFLAQRGYFKETYFINYLKYLLYWKRPEYARALKYPQCLHFLEAVQSSEFREAIACTANAKFIEEQQILQWQYYTRKRQRLHVILRCIPVGQRTRKRKMVNCQAPLSCCYLVFTFCALLSLRSVICEQSVNPPTKCEACVLFVREFEQQLTSNGPVQRSRSERELWLLEAMEGQCVRMLDYKLHKEKQGLARFSKQQSSTMKTLNKLRERGVKVSIQHIVIMVELGMPYELWDKPSVEVASLKQQCELILERYEDDIEQWFFSTDRLPLEKYLCEQRVLKGGDLSCIGNVHSEL